MDYNLLIDKAKEHSNLASDYAVAKALNYKNKSIIYKIREGKSGMSAEKLVMLMRLAGKTIASIALVIGITLPAAQDAQADSKVGDTVYYVKLCFHCLSKNRECRTIEQNGAPMPTLPV